MLQHHIIANLASAPAATAYKAIR